MANILVTGSSTGIGLATAVTLARAGHTVQAAMRNPATGAAEISGIAQAEKLPLTVVQLDVDSDSSVAKAFAGVGPVDVLVNNAGIGRMGSVEEMPLAEFRRVMETNFFGALRCMQAVLPGMRERRSGTIVNVTSVAGRIAGGAQGAYSASKWALEALSESLACEVKAFGIRVAVVEPGVIATPIIGKTNLSAPSIYPHGRRLDARFQASLKNPVSPYVVGDVIRGIVESDSPQLRYPVGPDAIPVMASRAATSDEDWIASQAEGDQVWAERMEKALGLKIEL
ncbi:MAG TPA: SDR family oxidoreductase [Candidatus Acidoferrum sp.]|nr:SDR family oxidoreductase [Candidatus Acidoferrum sp.]